MMEVPGQPRGHYLRTPSPSSSSSPRSSPRPSPRTLSPRTRTSSPLLTPTSACPGDLEAAPGCTFGALALLHSSAMSPGALDTVRCYQPWCARPLHPGPGVRLPADGDLAELQDRAVASAPPAPAASSLYPAALRGLGRIEDAFSLHLPLHLPLPTASRRPRSEKKPTPEDQKDQRYLERRRRNNRAAKKSRDARRAREDQVALRAALLEHENAVLRAQVMTLREETHSLRQLLIHSKGLQLQVQQMPLHAPPPPQRRGDVGAAPAGSEMVMRRI